ncbi:alpha/beta fold hydrolase [Cryptosporangium aurantiacum]|uniref:Pimeloyl-ACP methyl ester carboxylesterase n=1 Tax=Cryptosporangium aurantiacum TaxID=134849 RepID=A0A1M7RKZ9_9ACTN|nr:alpha/beta hydrolase [Cryptosporangium aurantiacum]SHN46993.1 Pimeloyl-ACP methyl ester carboxylesterase [Cryptosporangium aurantiacum]
MDEFGFLTEVADELGLPHDRIPRVTRTAVEVSPGREVSVLRWGTGPPELIFLHGGGQNAHTWDLVALHLGRPAIAIDLPGHGHSSWRDDRDYGPARNAVAVAVVAERLAPDARAVVGMSLGGLTTVRLAAARPDLVRRAVIVDATPGSPEAFTRMTDRQRGAVALTRGPRTFATLDEVVDAAVAASPRRPATAVRRGVVHNTKQLADGRWTWRYDRFVGDLTDASAVLWEDLASLTMPTMLVRGAESGFVSEADVAEARRRLPALRVEVVAGAGHAVQSDCPVQLADLIRAFVPNLQL